VFNGVQELTAKWQEVRELVPKRDAILQAEMVRQQNNERLREQFAAKANAVGQWLESRLDKVTCLSQLCQPRSRISKIYSNIK